MKQKTSMFGSAMSSYTNHAEKKNAQDHLPKKVGRPKGSVKKESTKSSFTTKINNEVLSLLKDLSEEKSFPINKIIEDFVLFAMISIGRGDSCHKEVEKKADLEKLCKYDLKVIAERYKRIVED